MKHARYRLMVTMRDYDHKIIRDSCFELFSVKELLQMVEICVSLRWDINNLVELDY